MEPRAGLLGRRGLGSRLSGWGGRSGSSPAQRGPGLPVPPAPEVSPSVTVKPRERRAGPSLRTVNGRTWIVCTQGLRWGPEHKRTKLRVSQERENGGSEF